MYQRHNEWKLQNAKWSNDEVNCSKLNASTVVWMENWNRPDSMQVPVQQSRQSPWKKYVMKHIHQMKLDINVSFLNTSEGEVYKWGTGQSVLVSLYSRFQFWHEDCTSLARVAKGKVTVQRCVLWTCSQACVRCHCTKQRASNLCLSKKSGNLCDSKWHKQFVQNT
jgi:hypothetical protein